jgi:hypothetical protein
MQAAARRQLAHPIPTRVDIDVPKEARKHFFFEKKKQKTLVLLPDAPDPSLTELE